MKQLKFKTTIKCQGCIQTVGPDMNQLAGSGHWSVDLQAPERILTVEAETVTPEEVISALSKTGYKAELVNG